MWTCGTIGDTYSKQKSINIIINNYIDKYDIYFLPIASFNYFYTDNGLLTMIKYIL